MLSVKFIKSLYLRPTIFCRIINKSFSTSSKKVIMAQKFDYTLARRDETIVDDFFGKKIADPYRWLEDPDSKETQEYVESQNKITQPYLESCEQWKILNGKLTQLWNYEKFTCPDKRGNKYFFYRNTGLQNQNVLYMQNSLTDEPEIFLDPNTLSRDGTIALSGTSFSDDGQFFAYGLSESGSDWIKIKIKNVLTGEDYPEVLEKVKFSSMAWTKDNKGLFYGRYPSQEGKVDGSETVMNENQKLYYHRVGEPQEKDVLVVEFPEEPTWRINAEVSDCGEYVIFNVVKDCRDNLVFFANLGKTGEIKGKLELTQVVHKFESDFDYITNEDTIFTFRTNKNAPNYRIINIDFSKPEEENWKTLVPEDKRDALSWVDCVYGNKLILCYIHDVTSLLQVHDLENGKLIHSFDLNIGSIVGYSGKKKNSEIFYQHTSFLSPGIIYRYDFSDPKKDATVYREIKLNLEGFDSSLYKVEQIFYNSKDNVKIPMFIIQKNTKSKQPRPCLLYGYGGFNISIQPFFSITGLTFIDSFDGVLAYPNIRGGGEFGEAWHNAGRLFNKQNVFDDFQLAAQYLIDGKYTTADKIVIQGGSNGGLLVGACINQRPDLFGAAVAQVGVMDMLRFHKFTIGHAWMSDYGNPDEEKHFNNLITYSPVHNVKAPETADKQYPATLIQTADHDDRVSPLHSLKFAAALHYAVKDSSLQTNPLLLRVYSKAGHGAGKPTAKKIDEATDILTFMYKSLNCTMTSN